jgi:AraC family transcriptional regulator
MTTRAGDGRERSAAQLATQWREWKARVKPTEGHQVLASSASLRWPGVVVEKGICEGWEGNCITPPKHYLAVNLASDVLRFEAIVDGRTRDIVLPPGFLWTCPAGDQVTHRVSAPSIYGSIIIEPDRLERAIGSPVRLERRYAVQNHAIEHVVRALIAETELDGQNGPAFAEALTNALAVQLARAFGVPLQQVAPGQLHKARLRRVFDLVEARLESGVSLEEMAAEIGLSAFHFARAFKLTTGTTPHQFLIDRRLERARQAVELGIEPLGALAARLGFADQSHFTRLFRRKFGSTPADRRR